MSLKGQRVTYDSLESDKKIQDVTFKELAIEYNNKTSKKFEEKDLISFGLVNEEGHLTITGSLFCRRISSISIKSFLYQMEWTYQGKWSDGCLR